MKTQYTMIDLGERVCSQRKHLALTQAELAAELGISQKTIAKIESGKGGSVAFGTVLAIMNATNWDLSIDPKPGYGDDAMAEQYKQLHTNSLLR